MPNPVLPARIETRRLVLRPFVPSDAAALTAVFVATRAHLQRFTGSPPAGIEQTLAYVSARRREAEEGWRTTYGVFLGAEPVGAVQLAGAGALGFWIAASHGHRGYATEAAAAVARAGFAAGRARLEVRCDVDNHASVAVARRLGCEPPRREDRTLVAELRVTGLVWACVRAALEARFPDGVPVLVSPVDAAGVPALELTATVAGEHAVALDEALRHNATLAIGALCLDGDELLLRHVVPLSSLGDAEAVRAALLVAHEAARLGRKLSAARDVNLFSTFAD